MEKKKKPFLYKASILMIIVALLIISYAMFSIIGSHLRAQKMLREWEELVDAYADISVTPTPEISSNISSVPDENPVESGNDSSDNPTPQPTVTQPVFNDYIAGLLMFPTIRNKKVVVVRGTSEEDIRGAAGMATYLTEPGVPGNTLVFGHRDGVFCGFANLSIGDSIIFKTIESEYRYKIESFTIVDPYDELISRNYDDDMLTLVTCYPFNYIGDAPRRYIVVARISD